MSNNGGDVARVKGSWSAREDALLRDLVQRHGGDNLNWSVISRSIPGRLPASCRNRWLKQLSPEVNHEPFTPEEDQLILQMHAEMGTRWTVIAEALNNGRTDNSVKNRWHSTLRRQPFAAVPLAAVPIAAVFPIEGGGGAGGGGAAAEEGVGEAGGELGEAGEGAGEGEAGEGVAGEGEAGEGVAGEGEAGEGVVAGADPFPGQIDINVALQPEPVHTPTVILLDDDDSDDTEMEDVVILDD